MPLLLDDSFSAKSASVKVSSVGRELGAFMSDACGFSMQRWR